MTLKQNQSVCCQQYIVYRTGRKKHIKVRTATASSKPNLTSKSLTRTSKMFQFRLHFIIFFFHFCYFVIYLFFFVLMLLPILLMLLSERSALVRWVYVMKFMRQTNYKGLSTIKIKSPSLFCFGRYFYAQYR